MQETTWEVEKAKEIDESYEIIYSGRMSTRNSAEMILLIRKLKVK